MNKQTAMSPTETRDHDTIKEWTLERKGEPAIIRDTKADDGEHAGVLRIKFDEDDDDLQEISWEEFFKIFEDRELTFLFEPEGESRFNKFIYK